MKKKIIAIMLVVSMSLVSLFGATAPVYAKNNAEIIKGVLRKPIIFDDLAKLTEAVKTDDGAKIFMCVLEIYPDFVAAIKEQLAPEDYNPDPADNNLSATPEVPDSDPEGGENAGAMIYDLEDNSEDIQAPKQSQTMSVSVSALVITAVICFAVGCVATVAIVKLASKPKKKRKSKGEDEPSNEQ